LAHESDTYGPEYAVLARLTDKLLPSIERYKSCLWLLHERQTAQLVDFIAPRTPNRRNPAFHRLLLLS